MGVLGDTLKRANVNLCQWLLRPKKKKCLFPVGRPTYLLTPYPNYLWAKYLNFSDQELRFEKKLSVLALILTEIGFFKNITPLLERTCKLQQIILQKTYITLET